MGEAYGTSAGAALSRGLREPLSATCVVASTFPRTMFKPTRPNAQYVLVASGWASSLDLGHQIQGRAVVIVGSPQRGRALLVVVLALLVLATLGAVPRDASAQPRVGDSIKVIVQKTDAADPAPELAARRLGGQVTAALPIVAGFAATLPAAARHPPAPPAGGPGRTPHPRGHGPAP